MFLAELAGAWNMISAKIEAAHLAENRYTYKLNVAMTHPELKKRL